MKAENLKPNEVKMELAPEADLAGEIWSKNGEPQPMVGLSQSTDTATKQLNGMQLADGGGLYIKFSEGRGLSEVGGYVTTNVDHGQITLMGGIELNGGKANEYLLGFDYKDIDRQPRRDRSEKPQRPSAGDSSNPRLNAPEGQEQRPERPDRPAKPVRPNHHANKPSNID